MSQSYFDVVVLGAQLAPLTCAALLSKRGFRVLLVGQDDLPPTYETNGVTLPRAPYTFLAGHSPVARRVLTELALHPTFRRRALAIDPALQVVLPKHRIDWALERADLDREIERELPEVKRPVEDFWTEVVRASGELDRLIDQDLVWAPETIFERRDFARAQAGLPFGKHGEGLEMFAELPESHPFRTVVEAPVRFSTDMDAPEASGLRLARLCAAWLRGSARLENGFSFLRDLLLERVVTHGGQVRERERVARIHVKRGAASSVQLAGSSEEIGCGFVVAGCDVERIVRLLPDRGMLDEMFERCGEPQPRLFRYTLNVVMRSEGLPVGMARDVFYVRDPRRPLQGDNALRIETEKLPTEGRHRLTIEALLARRSVEEMPTFMDGLRERILAAVAEVVPFLDKHIELVDSPHDGRGTQVNGEESSVPIAERWTRGVATMRAIYRYPVTSTLGVCAMPVRTPVRKLLLASSHVVPGLGQEGELLAAWSAARLVSRSDRRKERMRRGMWTKTEI